jgi:hypothetical protein
MGTTLTNGIYLPNEGEKNCYAGLKTNWETLDQKIADITALQQAVAGALHREIVESLPTTDIDPNTIYMVLSGTSATENVYDEFMYVNNAWELIGTSATDLTNYYTKAEVDGKLLLKANASDLTSHTGDTTIHVTANDKTKWTNSANTHVLRLALSALTPSTSDNSFSNLDDSTALKVGDKVMDTAGVLFEVTAIDTANSTFTIGTALIDLAQDSDVVHKSGNETVGGVKTFSDDITLQGTTTPVIKTISNIVQDTSAYNGSVSWVIRDKDNLNNILESSLYKYSAKSIDWQLKLTGINNSVSNTKGIRFTLDPVNNIANFIPIGNSNTSLGNSSTKWEGVYATNYYYGSNNVEFSTKFVTTDTNQTISGDKTFDGNTNCVGELSQTAPFKMTADTSFVTGSKNTSIYDQNGFQCVNDLIIYNNSKNIRRAWTVNNNSSGTTVSAGFNFILSASGQKVFYPISDNDTDNGSSSAYWKNTYTKRLNGVEPSSLSLPSSSGTVDISSYITDLTGVSVNNYTPSANGYIVITCNSNDVNYIKLSNNLDFVSVVDNTNNQFTSGILGVWQPCIAGIGIQIRIKSNALKSARFIPCQGNV